MSIRRSDGPTTGVVISSPTAGVVQFMLNRIDGPATGDVIISPTAGVVYFMLHRRGRFDGGVLVTNGAVIYSALFSPLIHPLSASRTASYVLRLMRLFAGDEPTTPRTRSHCAAAVPFPHRRTT